MTLYILQLTAAGNTNSTIICMLICI